MKTFISKRKCLPIFFFLLVMTCMYATAQKGSEKLKAPDKGVEFLPIDNFVVQCFAFYDSVYTVHNNLATIENQVVIMNPSEVESVLAQLNQTQTNITGMLPRIQSLIDAGTSMSDYVKSIPILKIPRALKNIKLAIQAIAYSLVEAKNALTLIPGLRQKLPGDTSKTATDSTAITSGTNL